MESNNLIMNIGIIESDFSCIFFFFLKEDRARIKLIIWRIKIARNPFFFFILDFLFKWNNNLTTNIGIIEKLSFLAPFRGKIA